MMDRSLSPTENKNSDTHKPIPQMSANLDPSMQHGALSLEHVTFTFVSITLGNILLYFIHVECYKNM